MDKDFLIQLTNNLYKMTLLFPKKEPLRYKMRELADEILVKPSAKDFETLNSFFEVAKIQNWVSPAELLKIQEDYSKLKEGLGSQKIEKKVVSVNTALVRQEKILEILKEKGKAQVGEFKVIFPEVTKRTLRRDFEFLLQQGAIERIGERNDTYYTLVRQSRTKGGEEDLSSSTQLKTTET